MLVDADDVKGEGVRRVGLGCLDGEFYRSAKIERFPRAGLASNARALSQGISAGTPSTSIVACGSIGVPEQVVTGK